MQPYLQIKEDEGFSIMKEKRKNFNQYAISSKITGSQAACFSLCEKAIKRTRDQSVIFSRPLESQNMAYAMSSSFRLTNKGNELPSAPANFPNLSPLSRVSLVQMRIDCSAYLAALHSHQHHSTRLKFWNQK
ncbi:hypothetical protein CEXT_515191 [Caerostris extrusa]|uniref:Uncharacterized protein n=1 Tax=Caerostris extrusa TaxID=172846 RepID=A0AAV4ML80_CAEEX|nr:hypothetical protein CEXT_515191 [Caerostris extrusa]